MYKKLIYLFSILFLLSCKSKSVDDGLGLITLDPAHFHAALLQKNSHPMLRSDVFVYAPDSMHLKSHLALVESYNHREENPTDWNQIVYVGDDFVERMLSDKNGDIVLLAGNNSDKADYISRTIAAGINVLSDKPMIITAEQFPLLRQAYKDADNKKVVLYDLMTERYDVLNVIQKALMQTTLFGGLAEGTLDNPVVTSESTHHFIKEVSGSRLIRPAWYYDVTQQGDGITDVTTHLIDQMMWKCFPETAIVYDQDVTVVDATRDFTALSLEEFTKSTTLNQFPSFLNDAIVNDTLQVYSNGSILFSIKGVPMSVKVRWDLEAPKGGGDTSKFIVRGNNANLLILQGEEQDYKPQLYVERRSDSGQSVEEFITNLTEEINSLQKEYPKLTIREEGENLFLINIPNEYRLGHEAHFTKVINCYIDYIKNQNIPQWEESNTLSKYFITTRALEIAKSKSKD